MNINFINIQKNQINFIEYKNIILQLKNFLYALYTNNTKYSFISFVNIKKLL